MAAPTSQGTAFKKVNAPTFTDFVVVDGTYEEADAVDMLETKDGASDTANFSFANPGIRMKCDWVVKNASTKAAVGNVVTATGAGAPKFLITACATKDYGGFRIVQSVEGIARDSVTLT